MSGVGIGCCAQTALGAIWDPAPPDALIAFAPAVAPCAPTRPSYAGRAGRGSRRRSRSTPLPHHPAFVGNWQASPGSFHDWAPLIVDRGHEAIAFSSAYSINEYFALSGNR